MARDPVWKQITVSRETPGPNRPTTDEEREQLGTRSEFRELGSYGEGFWKILQKGDPELSYEWERNDGGRVPPWFPNLKECQECTIGATYAKSRGGHPLREPTLVCINRDHYLEKARVGEAAYREKKAAQQRGFDRQDSKAVERFIREFAPLSDDACRALAVSLITARPDLEWQHPLGTFHEDWSYEAAPAARVRELTGGESVGNGSRWDRRKTVIGLDSLQSVTVWRTARVARRFDDTSPTPGRRVGDGSPTNSGHVAGERSPHPRPGGTSLTTYTTPPAKGGKAP